MKAALVWIIITTSGTTNAFEPLTRRKQASQPIGTYGTDGEQPLTDAGPNLERSSAGTNCLLVKLSYDGRRFTGGWDYNFQGRSVKSVIQKNFAKIYGNIAPTLMIVEAAVPSLDAGVHATGLVVKIYGLQSNEKTKAKEEHGTDDSLVVLPLPKSPNDICYAFNRLCDDIQIKAYHATTTDDCHFSIHSVTFIYQLSIGPRSDPIHRHQIWHIIADPSLTVLSQMQEECKRLVGTAANGLVDSMIVSRHETEYHGTWRYDMLIAGRMTDRLIRSYVASIVVAGYSEYTNKTAISVAPAHGLVLVDAQYDKDLMWRCANRYVRATLFIARAHFGLA